MDMKYYVLDRIEGETAILLSDGGDAHELPAASLPCGAAASFFLKIMLAVSSCILQGGSTPLWFFGIGRRLCKSAR